MFAGELLKKYREDRGLSARVLGEKLGVSGAYISQIEKGDRPLPPKRVSEITKVLELSTKDAERLQEICTFKSYRRELLEIAEGVLRFTRQIPEGYEVQITLKKISEE